jgi:hypothetical protein
MTAEELLEQHRLFVGEQGETIWIRRYASDGSHVDTATTARVFRTGVSPIAGNAVQYRYKIIALVDSLSALLPVTVADRVVLDNVTTGRELAILDDGDRKRRFAGTLVALEMECEG